MLQLFVIAVALGIVASPIPLPPPVTPAEPLAADARPNIVVLMLDDHAYMDKRVWRRLPTINALFIEQGIEAANFWGNDPLCCPGRANFLTGQVAHVNGVVRNDGRLLDPRTTIATELHDLGYYTNVCGKYLNKTDMLSDKTPPGWDNIAIMENGYYEYTAYVNGEGERHGNADSDYSTDVFAGHCMNFLQRADPDRPVFMFMTPYATHAGADQNGSRRRNEPAVAPRHKQDTRCDGVARWKPANYNPRNMADKPTYMQRRPLLPARFVDGYPLGDRCRSLLSVDEWVGRVTTELRNQGRFENTIFVLTADNGMGYGSFRWEKKVAPHVAQIPLFISWPAQTAAEHTTLPNLISNIDLAPTLCEFAGCEMGPYPNGHAADGQSLAGLIAPSLSSSVPARDSIVLEQRGNSVTPVWRAIMTDASSHELGRQWFYISYKTGEKELYDMSGGACHEWKVGMAGDPCMLSNRAATNPTVRRMLAAELAAEW